MKRSNRNLFLLQLVLGAGLLPAPAFALLCAPQPGNDCSTALVSNPTRLVLKDCPMFDNATPGVAGMGCSWDLCYASRNAGPLPTPPNATAYCNAAQAAVHGLTPGYYSSSLIDQDGTGLMDIDFRLIVTPSPTPSAPPPIPPGTCSGVGPPWADHVCGTGGCAPSALPTPIVSGLPSPLPVGTTFDNLSNKMAACCGYGWGENNNEAKKMDCVEAVPQGGKSFLDFYNFNDATATAPLTTGGVPYPNRMFVLGSDGVPLNGYYTQAGRRCRYRDPATKNPIKLTRAQQMALFDASLVSTKIPAGGTAEVDPLCCNLVLFALERMCPGTNMIGGIQVAVTDGGTRRCTAASSMKLDFAVFDFCDPDLVKRGRFRVATSYFNGDPAGTSYIPSVAIGVQNLVKEFYPMPSPTPPASPVPNCPGGAIIEIPWSGGLCDLATPRPSPTP